MTTTRGTTITPRSSGFIYASLGALLLAAAACGGAATPTTELQTARNVYSQARSGEAARLNPTGVHEAHQALQAAEKVHEDDAGSERERHYAYIALRKGELAISEASEALAKNEQQRAEQTYQAQLEQQSREASQQSSQYAQQLTQTRQALQQNTQSLQQQQQELEEARIAAEQAEAELRQAQALREEAGRMVINLSGVLFTTGGAELSELAHRRLDTVVQALRAYPERVITIEGYTDAQGSDEANRQLSQRRAEAVRSYLEDRGIPPERLRAVGKGETNPIASNDTPEGRANNRRVEISIDQAGAGSRSAEVGGQGESDRQNVSGRDSAAGASEPAPSGASAPAGQPKTAPQQKKASPPAPSQPPAPAEPREPATPPAGDSPSP